jgi:hypothetical protein
MLSDPDYYMGRVAINSGREEIRSISISLCLLLADVYALAHSCTTTSDSESNKRETFGFVY